MLESSKCSSETRRKYYPFVVYFETSSRIGAQPLNYGMTHESDVLRVLNFLVNPDRIER
jgi:hypothetical protein